MRFYQTVIGICIQHAEVDHLYRILLKYVKIKTANIYLPML